MHEENAQALSSRVLCTYTYGDISYSAYQFQTGAALVSMTHRRVKTFPAETRIF